MDDHPFDDRGDHEPDTADNGPSIDDRDEQDQTEWTPSCYMFVYPPNSNLPSDAHSFFVTTSTNTNELKSLIAGEFGLSPKDKISLEATYNGYALVIPPSAIKDFLFNTSEAEAWFSKTSDARSVSFRLRDYVSNSRASSFNTQRSFSKEQKRKELEEPSSGVVAYERLKELQHDEVEVVEEKDGEGDEDEEASDEDLQSGMWEDERYFTEYSNISIHWDMLSDTKRCEKYFEAIQLHRDDFKDKIVMDVGCGTGILSCFAAKMGARKVYAIEASDMWHRAHQVVEKNGFSDIVQVIHSRVEDIKMLPGGEEHVDIIVSEWMGVFLFFESMLDSVVWARDKWLLPEKGLLFPAEANIYLSILDFSSWYDPRVSFFTQENGVCGVDVSPLVEFAKESFTKGCLKGSDMVKGEQVLAPPARVLHLNIQTASKEDFRKFSSSFEFEVNLPKSENKHVAFHAFVSWFDVVFKGSDESKPDVVLSTTPYEVATHWKQDVFPIEEPIILLPTKTKENGEEVATVIGRIVANQSKQWRRRYQVQLVWEFGDFTYEKGFIL